MHTSCCAVWLIPTTTCTSKTSRSTKAMSPFLSTFREGGGLPLFVIRSVFITPSLPGTWYSLISSFNSQKSCSFVIHVVGMYVHSHERVDTRMVRTYVQAGSSLPPPQMHRIFSCLFWRDHEIFIIHNSYYFYYMKDPLPTTRYRFCLSIFGHIIYIRWHITMYTCVFLHICIFFSTGHGSFLVLSAPQYAWSSPEHHGAGVGPGRGPWHVLWAFKVASNHGEAFWARRAVEIHANPRTGWKKCPTAHVISRDLKCRQCRQTSRGDGKVFPRHQLARHATIFINSQMSFNLHDIGRMISSHARSYVEDMTTNGWAFTSATHSCTSVAMFKVLNSSHSRNSCPAVSLTMFPPTYFEV